MTDIREWLTEQVLEDRLVAETERESREANFKMEILRFHEAWPVLVEQEEPRPPSMFDDFDPRALTFYVSRKAAWMTDRAYIKHFGTEPPTTPMLRAMALIYRERPGFQDGWLDK